MLAGSMLAFFHENLQFHALKIASDSWYHPEFIGILASTKYELRFRTHEGHVYVFVGKFQYRVTEESLMDRLTTNTHATCLLIQKDCRSGIHHFTWHLAHV